ncbi:hypothetical protein [Sediminibacterium sp.]|uniref:HYC_CC_PP family protein n=1 Tax=Sediminibacterium sp. TaxID=1917865 RepID=UPI0027315528|nr:hypothetical protein [Sediminibacterium sp.]MDP2421345.1 hypothetical protein [Sediminibacterium sp.]
MKKASVIFLLIIYTSTSLGASINFHYCGGHLAHVSVLNFGGKTGCSCNPGAMPKDCCKDKLLISKADSHNSSQSSYIVSHISFVADLPAIDNIHNLLLNSGDFNADNSYTKHVKRSCCDPIYLLIRVFRI